MAQMDSSRASPFTSHPWQKAEDSYIDPQAEWGTEWGKPNSSPDPAIKETKRPEGSPASDSFWEAEKGESSPGLSLR